MKNAKIVFFPEKTRFFTTKVKKKKIFHEKWLHIKF